MSINNIGRADAQPISPEVLEVAYQEIDRLQQLTNEQAKQIDSLEHRLGNQAVTIKTQASTIARQAEEAERVLQMLKDGTSAHVLILKGDIYVTRRQLAHLLGDAYQEIYNRLEETPLTPQNPSICPKEPLLVPETAEPVAVHTAPNIRWAGGK